MNEIRRRPPEQSVQLAAGRVQSAATGGSVSAGPWTALVDTHFPNVDPKAQMQEKPKLAPKK